MPEDSRAFASICAMSARAREAVDRSRSRSKSKSGLMTPPSEDRNGGSSTIARSISSLTSSWDDIPSNSADSGALVWLSKVSSRIVGAFSRPRNSERISLGSDRPEG